MFKILSILSLSLICAQRAVAIPAYASLAGLSRDELDRIIPTLTYTPPPPPPGPLTDDSAKLVNDPAHPWKKLRKGDIRGPCPGLNTLASHGYLSGDGIVTPAQIITAVQEGWSLTSPPTNTPLNLSSFVGFNMVNSLARFVTYAAHLVDGNLITNLLSIGAATKATGPAPPAPAIAGGLNTHAVFEGDASSTRSDFFFGNNHDFNETLFQHLLEYANKYGSRKYNLTVAGEFKHKRIQDSIATNPTFDLTSPRIFTVYAEAAFPINFFIDGRQTDGEGRWTWGRNGSIGGEGAGVIAAAHPIQPGRNLDNRVNNYVVDPTSADLSQFCLLYTSFVKDIVVGRLYPNPPGVLREALKVNLGYFYGSLLKEEGCVEVFPYGQ